MTAKHTPGPWTRGEGTWSSHVIAPTKYGTDELTSFHGRGRDEDDANAQLTAAAPDLLEALEDLLAQVGRSDAIDTDKAREAVRKARGEDVRVWRVSRGYRADVGMLSGHGKTAQEGSWERV